jgi:hypothetical protein
MQRFAALTAKFGMFVTQGIAVSTTNLDNILSMTKPLNGRDFLKYILNHATC